MTRQEIERHDSYLSLRKQGVSWAEIGYGDSISADAARCWFNRARRSIDMSPSLYEDLSFSEVKKIMKEEYQVDFTSTREKDVIDTFENAPKNESEIPRRGSSLPGADAVEAMTSIDKAIDLVNIWTGQQFEQKKESHVAWRDHFRLAEEQQRLKREASGNNTFLKLDYSNDSRLDFINLGDLHFFSGGTNHAAIEELTDRILSFPNLRVVLLGDVLEMAINLRNVSEVTSQLAPPAIQLKVLEAWLEEMKDRILFSTHDNHSSERLEKNAGVDIYGWLMSRVVPFFDGIGVCNIKVGSQEYRVGATHKMRGRSMMNPTHGQSRYMRFDDQSLDAMLAGDSHQPGISQYWDGDRERLAVNVGTMNVNSAYAKRYFSLYSQPIFPVVTLYGKNKEMNAFRSLESWALAHGNK